MTNRSWLNMESSTPTQPRRSSILPEWNRVGASTTTHVEQQLTQLRVYYGMKSPISDVRRFLGVHGMLVPFLAQAKHYITQAFPEAAISFAVDVSSPNEEDYGATIWVSSNIPYREARARLKKLDEEWWFSQLPQTQGLVTLMVR